MNSRVIFGIGCISSALRVVIGAIGGHRKDWNFEKQMTFQKALNYQFSNSIGMIIAAFTKNPFIPFSLFFMANILFCLPLYMQLFFHSKNKFLSKCPPLGGICMILGWFHLAFIVSI